MGSRYLMPEMNGRDLAGRISWAQPGLNCLFMSGYAADVISDHGILEESVQYPEAVLP